MYKHVYICITEYPTTKCFVCGILYYRNLRLSGLKVMVEVVNTETPFNKLERLGIKSIDNLPVLSYKIEYLYIRLLIILLRTFLLTKNGISHHL